MVNVWVVNYRNHATYSKSEGYGQLKKLTEGSINVYKPDNLIADIVDSLDKEANSDDLLLLSGYAFVNALAVHYFLKRFGKAKTLIWDANKEKYSKVTVYDFDTRKEVKENG